MLTKIGRDNHIASAHMVLGRDLNPHDTLFAGRASEMLIECGFMEAMDFLQTKHIVCQGLDGFRFLRPVNKGDTIQLTSTVIQTGRSSVGIYLAIYLAPERIKTAEGFVTFVHIDEATGHSAPHGLMLGKLSEEEQHWQTSYNAFRAVKAEK